MTELVRFNGILVRGGVLGRSNGELYEIWNPNSPMHSPEIDQAMTLTRFGETKRNIKLRNNDAENIIDQEVYYPAYKFDLPHKDLAENINTIPEKYDENQVIDESSWPHCGYGEAGSGIFGRLYQNKKFTKGGKTLLCMDSGRFLICEYMHYQKLYNHKKRSWSSAGP